MTSRFKVAVGASLVHLLISGLVAACAAALVFLLWYPYPYVELSGGRELFVIVVTADIVCGPLLTLVLFNPRKPRKELRTDLSLVAIVQLLALAYGLHTVWLARPLYMVHEIDRFKVISMPDLTESAQKRIPSQFAPSFWRGPITISTRPPKDEEERKLVMFESVAGGADYAERPEFYVDYSGSALAKSLKRAKPLSSFVAANPQRTLTAYQIAASKQTELAKLFFVPVLGRKDWIAVLDVSGEVVGFMQGDGWIAR